MSNITAPKTKGARGVGGRQGRLAPVDLVNNVLKLAVNGDFDLAVQMSDELIPFLGPSGFTKTFIEIAAGHTGIEWKSGLYLLESTVELTDASIKSISMVRAKVASFLQTSEPIILVQPTTDLHQIFSISVAGGIGCIYVSPGQLASIDAEEAIAHEVAHCIFSCGQRFIDEGFATFVEYNIGGKSASSSINLPDNITLHYLVERNWCGELGFDSIDSNSRSDVYIAGANLFYHFSKKRPMSNLPLFFHQIRKGVLSENTIEVLETYFDASIDELAVSCGFSRDSAPDNLDVNGIVEMAEEAFIEADEKKARCNLTGLEDVANGHTEMSVLAAYLKNLSVLVFQSPGEIGVPELAVKFDSLATRYLANNGNSKDRFLIESFVKILKMRDTRSVLLIQNLYADIISILQEGIHKHPEDISLRMMFGRFLFFSPDFQEVKQIDYGELLDPVIRDSKYSSCGMELLEKLQIRC